MPRIIILGTSPSIRASAASARACGGIVIEGDEQLVIDPGLGTIIKAAQLGIDLTKTDAILTSTNDKAMTSDLDALKEIAHLKEVRSYKIAQHQTKDGLGSYRIEHQGFVLGYVASTSFNKRFIEEFKDSNILIINCHAYEKDNLSLLISTVAPELAILTGFDEKIKDPLEFTRELKQQLKLHRTQIMPAKEGMMINPSAYSIRKKQKNLSSFV